MMGTFNFISVFVSEAKTVVNGTIFISSLISLSQ